MKSGMIVDREEQVAYVSSQLLSRAALLTRLIVRQLQTEMSRTEAGVLNALRSGPRRITDLAEMEGLAQPTMTLLLQRLEQQGLVARGRHAGDGRVVLVSLTKGGETALDEFVAHAGAVLRGYLEEISDEDVEALAVATETLETLLAVMQNG